MVVEWFRSWRVPKFLLGYAGLTQRDVAGLLGLGSGGAVSFQVKRYDRWLANDHRLRQKIEKLERDFKKARERRQG